MTKSGRGFASKSMPRIHLLERDLERDIGVDLKRGI